MLTPNRVLFRMSRRGRLKAAFSMDARLLALNGVYGDGERLMQIRMWRGYVLGLAIAAGGWGLGGAQVASKTAAPAKVPAMKRVLVIGQTKGFEHDSVSAAMDAVYQMGKQSGLWNTIMRTDTELLTKDKLERNAKNIDTFDVLVFASTTGELDMTAEQKRDMLAFVKDDGKGFVGIHAALDTNYTWPDYGEMIGGWFNEHPVGDVRRADCE